MHIQAIIITTVACHTFRLLIN